jgi:hypothetical protein
MQVASPSPNSVQSTGLAEPQELGLLPDAAIAPASTDAASDVSLVPASRPGSSKPTLRPEQATSSSEIKKTNAVRIIMETLFSSTIDLSLVA